jgi:hypothetical protein
VVVVVGALEVALAVAPAVALGVALAVTLVEKLLVLVAWVPEQALV